MHSVGWQTFDWDRVPIQCLASNDEPYTRHIVTGMPRVPDALLKSVFFLYPSENAARDGRDCGGSGFIAAFPYENSMLKGHNHYYAVSNHHVVCKAGCPVIRFNKHDGGVTILPHDVSDWDGDPQTDVSALPLDIDPYAHEFHYLGQGFFLKEEEVEELNVGIGEDVVMIGRFIDHDGRERNQPSVRFGHISMMPSNIHTDEGPRPSFCLDMRSRSGYSGSPVIVYQTPGSSLDDNVKARKVVFKDGFLRLLGINWGSFPEEVKDDAGEDAKVPSAMTCVSPAWAIRDVLMMDRFVQQRKEKEDEAIRDYKRNGFPADEDVAHASDERKGDELLGKMLNTPPKPHGTK